MRVCVLACVLCNIVHLNASAAHRAHAAILNATTDGDDDGRIAATHSSVDNTPPFACVRVCVYTCVRTFGSHVRAPVVMRPYNKRIIMDGVSSSCVYWSFTCPRARVAHTIDTHTPRVDLMRFVIGTKCWPALMRSVSRVASLAAARV